MSQWTCDCGKVNAAEGICQGCFASARSTISFGEAALLVPAPQPADWQLLYEELRDAVLTFAGDGCPTHNEICAMAEEQAVTASNWEPPETPEARVKAEHTRAVLRAGVKGFDAGQRSAAVSPLVPAPPEPQKKYRERSIEQLRETLGLICDFVWSGGTAYAGKHFWSIPPDQERDFDLILSDAINEIEALRAAAAVSPTPQAVQLEAAMSALEAIQRAGYYLHDRQGKVIADRAEYYRVIALALDAAVSQTPDPQAEVWIVETGDYEQRGVMCVGVSAEAALVAVRAVFVSPYLVTWETPRRVGTDQWSLVGHFEQVLGYSTQHTAEFDATRYPLHRLSAPPADREETDTP